MVEVRVWLALRERNKAVEGSLEGEWGVEVVVWKGGELGGGGGEGEELKGVGGEGEELGGVGGKKEK